MAAKRKKAAAPAGNKALTKSEVFTHLAERAELTRKQVRTVFDELSALAGKSLTKGPGTFTIPGLPIVPII